jgi:MtN3 and saliva related transmembrane protein
MIPFDLTLADFFGAAGATLTTVSFVPQALQVLRTRETGAISLAMYALFTAGVAMWGVYGLMTGQLPIILANAVTVTLASLILALKVRDVWRARGAGRRA